MDRRSWTCMLLLGALACGGEDDTKSSDASDAGDDASVTTDTGDAGTTDAPSFDAAAELERLLVGHYDSSAQAASSRDYYNIMLTMCPVSVPDIGERVLYVEQTAADTPDEPYRQRLYVLEAGANEFEAVCRIYELAGPRTFTGTCNDPEAAEFPMDRVLLLEGCDVTLVWDGEQFVGGTDDTACGTDFGGATYATSEIVLDEEVLVSWDRGYGDDGRQVWGATGGGYEFVRLTDIGSW